MQNNEEFGRSKSADFSVLSDDAGHWLSIMIVLSRDLASIAALGTRTERGGLDRVVSITRGEENGSAPSVAIGDCLRAGSDELVRKRPFPDSSFWTKGFTTARPRSAFADGARGPANGQQRGSCSGLRDQEA